jgi:hypothetical protein
MSKPLYEDAPRGFSYQVSSNAQSYVPVTIEALTKLLSEMPEKEKEVYEKVNSEMDAVYMAQAEEKDEDFRKWVLDMQNQISSSGYTSADVFVEQKRYDPADDRRKLEARIKAEQELRDRVNREREYQERLDLEKITGSMRLSRQQADVVLNIEQAVQVYLDESVDITFAGVKYMYVKIPEMGRACLTDRIYNVVAWCALSERFGDYKIIAALLDKLARKLYGPVLEENPESKKAKAEKPEQTRPFEF